MGLPTSDTTTVTDLTETRIAWTTRSMLLGFVPTQMNWAYNLEGSDSGTRVANILERVSMMGLPIGLLVKLPFLPFPYMVRSTMTASEKKLLHSLNP